MCFFFLAGAGVGGVLLVDGLVVSVHHHTAIDLR
jgi:hypothetical protein